MTQLPGPGEPGYWDRRAAEDNAHFAAHLDPKLDFGDALMLLKAGRRVAREGWNGRNMWLELQRPDANSKMTLPYIYMRTAQDDFVPWLASQTDMLAEDWSEVLLTQKRA